LPVTEISAENASRAEPTVKQTARSAVALPAPRGNDPAVSRTTPQSFVLRPFRLEDAAVVAGWLAAPGLSIPPGQAREDWPARMMSDRRILARVAIRQHRIVAFARLDCGPDRVAEVTLVVDPDCRRQGLGRAVLDSLVAEARARGLRRLQAMVDPAGAEAMPFFRECGFEEEGLHAGRIRFVRIVHAGFNQTPLEIDV
jgi:ribosomal protein S18 acetylase RimI-like enzyme